MNILATIAVLLAIQAAVGETDQLCHVELKDGKFVRSGSCKDNLGALNQLRQSVKNKQLQSLKTTTEQPTSADEKPTTMPVAGAKTCQELQERGSIASGQYQLTTNAGDVFSTYCNFTADNAITEVRHDIMDEIKISPGCNDNGCYSKSPQYNLNDEQILSIIQNSRECRQYIKARCNGMRLFYGGSYYAWWVSRDGGKMTYWGGARRDGYCACGETGSCIDNAHKCNCDQNANDVTTQDEGYLTDKTKLPVKELRFGDTDHDGEHGWHTLGKLECWGKA